MFSRSERFSVPELPEVETVVRDLRPMLVGRVLGKLRRSKLSLRTRWLPKWEPLLLGRTVARIDPDWIEPLAVEFDCGHCRSFAAYRPAILERNVADRHLCWSGRAFDAPSDLSSNGSGSL